VKAVFGTIPDITGIGYLLNRQDLIRFLGSDQGLPEGSLTTLPAMLLVKLGLANGSIFSNPNYVLDPAEQQAISAHINSLNDVIRSAVTAHGMALADTHAVFDFLSREPLNFFGVRLTTRFLGGIFSLDGVHPSNIGHALAAFFFIEALNQHYGAGIPQIDPATFFWLTITDPFVDKDGDGRVTGRFGFGLLETLMGLLSFSGDPNDGSPSLGATFSQSSAARQAAAEAAASGALDAYARQTGEDLRTMSPDERVKALHKVFGTTR